MAVVNNVEEHSGQALRAPLHGSREFGRSPRHPHALRREDLVRGLHLVQGVVERRNTLPILSNVLVEPAEGGIALTATDMEVGLRGLVPAQMKKKGSVTLNARKLYEIAREVTAEEVTLKSAQVGWVDLLAGRSKFRIVSLDPKDFPQLPLGTATVDGTSVRLAAGTLREMVDKTLFAVSSDETRFNLSGVFLSTPEAGTLRMVATDGHRLALVDRRVPEVKLPRGVIMPRKGLLEARKLLDETGDEDVTVVVSSKDVRLATPAVSFFMRLVEGEFPDYQQVIPAAPRAQVRVNRDDLFAALRRISLLASERSRGVKFQLERGRLELSASNPDQGEASEDVEITYAGDSLTLGFNARYVIDVLAVHGEGEVIELGFTDEVGPALLRASGDPDYTYVVMPMRL
ncbi:MAG: DNA polymerase III subunit beta [Deltaproteobacteria bacterium]|nr:MAG: DNA polymerase III subunit beta [Deltaproteobacteria bacterium]